MEEWAFVDDRDLQNWKGGVVGGVHDLPVLRLWRRPALPHDGGLQSQTEATSTGSASKEALQALGTHLAKASGLGA